MLNQKIVFVMLLISFDSQSTAANHQNIQVTSITLIFVNPQYQK
jgi:hypothetical protein